MFYIILTSGSIYSQIYSIDVQALNGFLVPHKSDQSTPSFIYIDLHKMYARKELRARKILTAENQSV